MLIPYLNKWPQAMALKGFPANTPSALQTLALMVDDMWYWAGDRSTDFSWYTKRALLTSIYISTGVCMFYVFVVVVVVVVVVVGGGGGGKGLGGEKIPTGGGGR